jgi:signal transduction histidine kinase
VADVEAPLRGVLDLSRSNRDDEARAALARLESPFDAIGRDVETLIRINRDESAHALTQIRELERASMTFLGGITTAGILIALLVAASVTRLARQRDEQVRQAALLLETRNRELDAFAGRVAHDLRGPLTTISLSAGELSQRAPLEARTIDLLRKAVSRMEAMIEDLLTLSRIDAQPPGAVCDPATVARSVAQDLAPAMRSVKGILQLDVAPASVRCSEGLLYQALWNLCDNALKYRRPEVQLELVIRGRTVARRYQLCVSDNGSGMTPEETHRACEPFYRGEQVRPQPGTGLGLSIVKRVIEASGGTISLESTLGQGTTFLVELPLGDVK